RELVRQASVENKHFATKLWLAKSGKDIVEISYNTLVNAPTVPEALAAIPELSNFARQLSTGSDINVGDILFLAAPTNDAFAGRFSGKPLDQFMVTVKSNLASMKAIIQAYPQCAELVPLGRSVSGQ